MVARFTQYTVCNSGKKPSIQFKSCFKYIKQTQQCRPVTCLKFKNKNSKGTSTDAVLVSLWLTLCIRIGKTWTKTTILLLTLKIVVQKGHKIVTVEKNTDPKLKLITKISYTKLNCNNTWKVFEYGVFLVHVSPYSVPTRQNMDQKNSILGLFSRSVTYLICWLYYAMKLVVT